MLLSVTGIPSPPAGTPPGFTPAPVPNHDITSPLRPDDDSPTLSGRLKQPHILLRSGDGFTPDSNYSEDMERRSRNSGIVPGLEPSLTLKFPLD